jgi:hypothetical protein
MASLAQFRKHLKPGKVYRRADLEAWSNSVDRHLGLMVKAGSLQKLSQGLYYCPKESVFGTLPPSDEVLIQTFLKDDHFLLTSPNDYNRLGVGTTQLYNKRIVYNHKRHGEFQLGGRTFTFHAKHRFPKKLSDEFLIVDLLNNLDNLAEDKTTLVQNISLKVRSMDLKKLRKAVSDFGSVRAKKLLGQVLNQREGQHT